MARKKYGREIKEEAIQQHLDGKGVSAISKDLGIPTSTVGTWISNADKKLDTKAPSKAVKEFIEPTPTKDTLVEEVKEVMEVVVHDKDEEIKRLKEELELVKELARQEVNTLREAIIIMAKNER
jgi:transposase-like protein